MGYYHPFSSNLDSGWYRTTNNESYAAGRNKLDKIWDSQCDKILVEYIKKHGAVYKAFLTEIRDDVETLKGVSLRGIRYYEYYFQNRALEIPGIKDYLIESYQKINEHELFCNLCSSKIYIDLISPYNLKTHFPPKFCKDCFYYVQPYYYEWDDDIRNRILNLFDNIHNERECSACKRKYLLEDELFSLNIYLPIIHANIFASICNRCLEKIIYNEIKDTEEKQLKKLYNLYEFLQKVPNEDYGSFYYLFRDEAKIIELTKLLGKLWAAQNFKEKMGSFFLALIKSGILPEGTQKLKMGTKAMAKDGHVCFSIVEKDIDDFLFKSKILHKKEVYYPGSEFRADWEVVKDGKRCFIEYFGLMSKKEYALKVEHKRIIAIENNIELIAIYPETKWKDILINLKI